MKKLNATTIVVAMAAMIVATTHTSTLAGPEQVFHISPILPTDIPGGAPNATAIEAAKFAWREFIALNWPAVTQDQTLGTRDTPDLGLKFGDPNYKGPLTWHTYRSKAEIFPGRLAPPGGTLNPSGTGLMRLPPLDRVNYGYDYKPTYIYQDGPISGSGTDTPWINLDEASQIGLDNIYAGVARENTGSLANQILFLAKANRAEFDYIAPKGWWDSGVIQPFAKKTAAYIQKHRGDPKADSPDLVSFKNGTIELKAAWRKLGAKEDVSRFYTTKARYYVKNAAGGIEFVDETLALIALHIIHKTPSAPYFIFATFEQADNITDTQGKPVEDENGFVKTPPATPFTPNISSNNSTPTSNQTFTPMLSTVTDPSTGKNPDRQLYYINVPFQNLVEGKILVNKRKHPITADVIKVNKMVHDAINKYMIDNFNTISPWAYYKLINVQHRPIEKTTFGKTYVGADISTYYQANSVVETDYNLQVFSGRFSGRGYGNTISDYKDGEKFYNVAFQKNTLQKGMHYNMGGCMGCHGNMQQAGFDFSFILGGGRVTQPDVAGPTLGSELAKIQKYLQNQ